MPFQLLADVFIAYVLDLVFGDPHWLPHPVRGIGWLVKRLERVLREIISGGKAHSHKDMGRRERYAGLVLAVAAPLITLASVWAILGAAMLVSPWLFHAANIYFIYSSLAARCMANEAGRVYAVLAEGDIAGARRRLSMLVGRETKELSEPEVIRGAVETTAENTVDGVISPVIYAAVGSVFGIGAPLAYAFKAVSTLDSMVGYMNERYINFGRASAKADDAANYIPARLSGIIIPLAALLCGMDFRGSMRIMLRDRRNHKSPNCAYPEAAVAGALGVQIGGSNVYFGQTVEKPAIGDPRVLLRPSHIRDTIRLMYAASAITVAVALGAAAAVKFLL
ncbi:adenosylcobinamide-phosphate synthase [Anaerobacterium chartisolvens]|uniref:Cobalamin biosynthesis protein CobD n=1 Tax=Anaerobacterium chartisolvens TaxID=1297424 RepID=A0A369B7R3_9FIRM|nr:adenosylcobinamide-phosphate synthase CbiB [Anaerobacterium chartisolvens]RCX17563.1 adenosylcobinamide-phosphate synthase [Anaerobacterium chartisolvens]